MILSTNRTVQWHLRGSVQPVVVRANPPRESGRLPAPRAATALHHRHFCPTNRFGQRSSWALLGEGSLFPNGLGKRSRQVIHVDIRNRGVVWSKHAVSQSCPLECPWGGVVVVVRGVSNVNLYMVLGFGH